MPLRFKKTKDTKELLTADYADDAGVFQAGQADAEARQLPGPQCQRGALVNLHRAAGVCAAALHRAPGRLGAQLHAALRGDPFGTRGADRPARIVEILRDSIGPQIQTYISRTGKSRNRHTPKTTLPALSNQGFRLVTPCLWDGSVLCLLFGMSVPARRA